MEDGRWINHSSSKFVLVLVLGIRGRGGGRTRTVKSLFDPEFGLGGCAVGADAIFDGDGAGLVFAERGVNQSMVFADVAVDDGQVFLEDGACFPDFAEFTSNDGIFGDEDEAGSFAVEPVDEVGRW